MSAHDAMERHERSQHLPQLGPLGRRVAMVVAVLAALLAISEVVAENRIAHVITAETKIADAHGAADLEMVRASLAREPSHAAALESRIPSLESDQAHAETAHGRLELAIVLLQVGIVLASVAALLTMSRLLAGGAAFGLVGAVMLLAGLLA
jgi:hypothetical protein